jgi:hypothetical protein
VRQLRASNAPDGADSSGLEQSDFGLDAEKRLSHAVLRGLPKLRVASSSLVARFAEKPRLAGLFLCPLELGRPKE